MIFKNLILYTAIFVFYGCTSLPLNDDIQERIEGKFSFFSTGEYISGNIMLSKKDNISQIKLTISGVPRSFLITESLRKDSYSYKYNFNEFSSFEPVKYLIEDISISQFLSWLLETCKEKECRYFEKKDISIIKESFYGNKRIKKIIGKYKQFQFAMIFK
jgi:hypothetical protein